MQCHLVCAAEEFARFPIRTSPNAPPICAAIWRRRLSKRSGPISSCKMTSPAPLHRSASSAHHNISLRFAASHRISRDGLKKRATPFARSVVTSRFRPIQNMGPIAEAPAHNAKLKDEGPKDSWSRPLANSIRVPIFSGGNMTLGRCDSGMIFSMHLCVVTNISSCFVLLQIIESSLRGIKS